MNHWLLRGAMSRWHEQIVRMEELIVIHPSHRKGAGYGCALKDSGDLGDGYGMDESHDDDGGGESWAYEERMRHE